MTKINPSPGLRPPSPGGRGDYYNLSHIRKAVASRPFSPGEKVPDRADEGAFDVLFKTTLGEVS